MHEQNRKFSPRKADFLLSEERYHSTNPEALLREIGVKAGMYIADVGCGNGFFTIPAARMAAPGIVYGLDESEEMLENLQRRTPPPNLKVLRSEGNRFPLGDDSVDYVLAVRLFHELNDRPAFLEEVRRVLRGHGKIWIMDWLPKGKDAEEGPPDEIRIQPQDLAAELSRAKFAVLWSKLHGDSHYHLLAEKERG